MIKVSVEQFDALKELINIGMGKAGNILNEMLKTPITLDVILMKIFPYSELSTEVVNINKPVISVHTRFSGAMEGMAILSFPEESISKLIKVLTEGKKQNIKNLDTVSVEALTEIGNVVLNGVVGSISNILKLSVQYTIPVYLKTTLPDIIEKKKVKPDLYIILAKSLFKIEKYLVQGEIILFFTTESFDELLRAVDSIVEKENF
ncbi:MAG: chemotaxis protein CheX [Candidatus Theseobacter exili]|nr:chemotaxis protein CheX [Candidatus Theseobacter exili]